MNIVTKIMSERTHDKALLSLFRALSNQNKVVFLLFFSLDKKKKKQASFSLYLGFFVETKNQKRKIFLFFTIQQCLTKPKSLKLSFFFNIIIVGYISITLVGPIIHAPNKSFPPNFVSL